MKSLPAHVTFLVQHTDWRKVGIKVILHRVERLENIGKVRGKGAARALLFSFRQQDAYGMGCTRVKGSSVSRASPPPLEEHKHFFVLSGEIKAIKAL